MTKKKATVLIHKTISSKIQQDKIILVSCGYARNYLIPKQIASLVTPNILKKSYKHQKIQNQKNQQQYNNILNNKNTLEYINKFHLKRKTGADYRFFGSITSANIIQIIFTATGILVDKKQIDLVPMRKIGIYTIKVQISSDLATYIQIQISPVYN